MSQKKVSLRFCIISQWKCRILLLYPSGFLFCLHQGSFWMLNYSCWWYKTKILLWKVDAKKYQIFLSKDNSIVSTRFHKVFLYVIFLSLNINPCHINYIFSSIFWKFYHFCVSSFRDLFLFIIYITLFVSHKSIIWHRFFMHTSVLHHEYLWVYISTEDVQKKIC